MGAEVIKIERPGNGDDARNWGPPFLDGESLWFLSVNRNKRSVTLDFQHAAGRSILYRLVRTADIFIVNLIERTQRKLGVDYETLKEINPQLIFVSLTGFGVTGPRANNVCYDLIAEGYSGVMDLTGEPGREPQKIGTPAADLLAGMDGAYSALAAVYDRSRTGRGHKIDISMVESMTRFLSPRIVPYLGSGEVPRRSGAKDSVIAIYQTFDTADDPITLGLGNDAIWQRFWEAVGRPQRAADPEDADNAKRRARRTRIVGEIQEILSTRPRREWLECFRRARVPAGPINRVDEVTADAALIERGLFYAVDEGEGRTPIPQVNTGIRIDNQANAPRRPPCRLGADTDHVLGELLGLSTEEIRELRDQKVV
jgi:crotonobetainyl-CoA:carnitine CoA-transferase CaiB-like acyl-CoA transferase